jgi:hypothetical protein
MDCERIFFITSVTAQRRPIFRREDTAELLISTLAHYHGQGKFLLHEFVVMPDHIHALLTPASEISLERVMQFIKGGVHFGSAVGMSGSRVSVTIACGITKITKNIVNISG